MITRIGYLGFGTHQGHENSPLLKIVFMAAHSYQLLLTCYISLRKQKSLSDLLKSVIPWYSNPSH